MVCRKMAFRREGAKTPPALNSPDRSGWQESVGARACSSFIKTRPFFLRKAAPLPGSAAPAARCSQAVSWCRLHPWRAQDAAGPCCQGTRIGALLSFFPAPGLKCRGGKKRSRDEPPCLRGPPPGIPSRLSRCRSRPTSGFGPSGAAHRTPAARPQPCCVPSCPPSRADPGEGRCLRVVGPSPAATEPPPNTGKSAGERGRGPPAQW